MSYIAGDPKSLGTRQVWEGAATAGQRSIVVPGGFVPGSCDVFVGGANLLSADYVDSDGGQILLNTGMVAGTAYRVVVMPRFSGIVQNTSRLVADGAATAGQTIIPIAGGFMGGAGMTDVFVNGIALTAGSDYDDTSGTQIVLTKAMNVGMQYRVVSYAPGTQLSAVRIPMDISQGGTSATTAAQALVNLGVTNAGGQNILPDGTAVAPGLTFASELGLGWYRAGAGQINFSQGGVEKARFTFSATAAELVMKAPAGNNFASLVVDKTGTGIASFIGRKAGLTMWSIEAPRNDDNFAINRFSVAGAFMDTPITIPTNTGDVWVARNFVAGVSNGGAGFGGAAGFVANAAEQSVFMYGIGGGPAYRLGMQVSSGNTFLVANGTTYWTQSLGNTFVLNGANKGWQSGGGPWADTSDERIKEDIQPFTRGLDAILSLEPVSYRFKPETGRGDKRYIRLIAQKAKIGFPELVTIAPGEVGELKFDDLHALDEGPVLWALVNAVKKLHARIAELEGKA